MSDQNVTDGEMIDRIASLQLRSISDNRRIGFEGYLSNSKWFLASLLALNSGGLFAALNLTAADYPITAAGAFFLGIVFSLAVGWWNQRTIGRSIALLDDYEAFLLEAQRSKFLSISEGEELVAKVRTEGRAVNVALNAAAVISFSVGALWSGISKFSEPSYPTCSQSQKQ